MSSRKISMVLRMFVLCPEFLAKCLFGYGPPLVHCLGNALSERFRHNLDPQTQIGVRWILLWLIGSIQVLINLIFAEWRDFSHVVFEAL